MDMIDGKVHDFQLLAGFSAETSVRSHAVSSVF
jgi:hypothetical protein